MEVITMDPQAVKVKNKPELPDRNESKEDPFKGPVPIAEKRKDPYKRGNKYDTSNIIDRKLKRKLKSTESNYTKSIDQAARYDLLLTEEPGYLEVEEGEESWRIGQSEIADAVDITSASKHFELNLNQFGPYFIDYTRNGRHLLLGGRRGHLVAVEWVSKQLMCEVNVMEAINDVQWLHSENMFAVAQRKWTYIYDNQGVELHCLKSLDSTLRLDFLPYHFLLVATNRLGFLQYLDVSMGKIIATTNTKGGRLDVMTHNPHNAVVLLGHHNGTVSMWSPNQREPLVRMLCHKTALRALAVDQNGRYLATSGQDRQVKIFDVRTYKALHTYRLHAGPSRLQFSQRGNMLAACYNNVVQVYKDPCLQVQEKPYLSHRLRFPANDLKFCPYEDVLGVGRSDGFVSLLTPGSGEPNYDGFESNPNRTKQQRREWEVKMLLEKIQPDLISLDPLQLTSVDHVTQQQLEKDKETRLGYKPDPPKFEPRHKKKGKSKAGNLESRKKKARDRKLREHVRTAVENKREQLVTSSADVTTTPVATTKTVEKDAVVEAPQRTKAKKKGALQRFLATS